MKLLMFTDYHISSKGRRTLRRLAECLSTAEWLAGLVEEHEPDTVANLGDTFDSHSNLDVPSLCTGVRAMEQINLACQKVGADFIMLPGNHDAYSMDYSSLEAFKGMGIKMVWKPTVFNGLIGAMPFTKNAEMATTWIHELEEQAPIVLTHVDVKHASFGYGQDSDVGVDPAAFRGPIFSGHYHHPHDLEAFRFIGSVLHHNFTDKPVEGIKRGALLVDIDERTGKVTKTQRFPNPHTPVYYTANWTKKQGVKAKYWYDLFPGRLHLRVKCNQIDVRKYKEEIQATFPDLLSYSVVGVNRKSTEVERVVTVNVDTDPTEALKAFLDNKGVPPGMSKKKLMELGEGLLK